jgi:CRP-like cAMP-binding protein
MGPGRATHLGTTDAGVARGWLPFLGQRMLETLSHFFTQRSTLRSMVSRAETLARVPLFQCLSPTQLEAVAARFREDRFARDHLIFNEGETSARFWVVSEGQVKIVKYGESGKEIVVEVISPGEVFGGATMLIPRQPATAMALSDVAVLSLPVDDYKQLLREHPVVAVQVIETLGERMQGFIRMRAMAGERVERRIAHILLKLAHKFGEKTEAGWVIRAGLTRQDIAELADTTVETAIRVMSRLRKEGVVRTLRGGYVVILDRRALQDLAGTQGAGPSSPPGEAG